MCIREIRKALDDRATSPRFIQSIKGRGYRFVDEIRMTNDTPRSESSIYEFPFVGRGPLLKALHAAGQTTVSDLRGRTILIVGEAGVGKTRLISEFIGQVTNRVDVITARAASTDCEFPYSIWTQVLRTAVTQHPKNRQLAESVSRISRVLPELKQTESHRLLGPESADRFSFHLEWAACFRSIVSQRPLIVVLEDIHHADQDSLLLLERITTEIANLPITLVATARPCTTERGRASATARLLGSTDSTLLRVSPLTLQEVESILDPYEQDRGTIAAEIFRQSAGNAFYVTYLAHLHIQNPRPAQADLSRAISQDAAEIVARQLNDLPESSREILIVASVLGLRFSAQAIASMLSIPSSSAIERLTSAEKARIVSFDGVDYTFCHAILQELLYWSTDLGFRAELHSVAAETLQRLRADQNALLSIFDHLFRAYPIATCHRICEAGIRAGLDAVSRYAFHEAIRVLERSLSVIRRDLAADPATQCDLMIVLSRALLYSGDRATARSTLLEAAQIARSIDSPHRLAQCGLDLAPDFLSIEVGTYDPELVMTLKESLQNLPLEEVALRARVVARLSQTLQWEGSDQSEQEQLAKHSAELAFSSRDQSAIASALAAVSDSLHGPDRLDERVQRILELQDASLSRSERYSFMVQQTRLIAALLEKGEVRRISVENERYRFLADRIGLPQYCWYPVSTDSMLACLAGRFDVADQFAQRYAEIAGPNADENFRQTYACQFVLREIERDRSEGMLSVVEDFAQRHRSVLSWSAAIAWIQWDCGFHQSARETLRQFSTSDIQKMYREPGGTIGLAALAETSAYLGDAHQVRFLYDLIAPVSHRFASAGYGVAYFGSLARYASVLAIALRRQPEAVRFSQFALDQELRLQSRSWEILARLDQRRAQFGKLDIRNQYRDKRSLRILNSIDLPRAARRIHQTMS